ncbi:NUDIX hydrolase [Enemella sp. A6]|uniref:NUDIX hydrolase n=1 Tax=Enemella sp. A6 TaxID=3440152 RepID=UPI003EB9DD84
MSKKLIRAAGAVVLRASQDGPEVLVVHRPRYDDWSLPKGKLEGNEIAPVAAVREVAEETGVRIRLSVPLDRTTYTVKGHAKEVDWWLGFVADETDEQGPIDLNEVDEVAWWPVDRARAELTQRADRDLVAQAVEMPRTTVLMVVRHGKAIDRKNWGSDENTRPLAVRGEEQSLELVDFFGAYGIERITSSPWARCMQTVTPYATHTHRVVEPIGEITEAAFEQEPSGVARATTQVAERAASGLASLVCGHRPVLPCIFEALGVPNRSLSPGGSVVLHLADDGEVIALEVHDTET